MDLTDEAKHIAQQYTDEPGDRQQRASISPEGPLNVLYKLSSPRSKFSRHIRCCGGNGSKGAIRCTSWCMHGARTNWTARSRASSAFARCCFWANNSYLLAQ